MDQTGGLLPISPFWRLGRGTEGAEVGGEDMERVNELFRK